MTDQERASLQAVLDYCWEDEAKDYAEQPDDNHVFVHLMRLQRLLDREEALR